MSNPMHSVAVVGVYNTKQARVLPGETTLRLTLESVMGAIADAGLKPSDINGVATGGTTSAAEVIFQLGGRPSWSGGGADITSVITAANAIGAGMCDTVVVAGGQAGSYTERDKTAPWTRPTNEFVEAWGLYTAAEFGLIAQRHMYEYGTKAEALAEVASAVRMNGATNPQATYYGREVTPEDVLNSRIVADPFHLLDCCTATEGGAGLVLTTVERARDLNVKPVYILGGAQEQQGPAYRMAPVWEKFGLNGRWAGERAFRMAGLAPKDIDVCEFYDNFSFEIIRLFEAYGFCGEGEGGDFVMGGRVRIDGDLPICTDGGLMSFSHAGNAQALQRVISGVLQIQGRAVNQVPDVDHVMVENYGSGALFTNCLILGSEPVSG